VSKVEIESFFPEYVGYIFNPFHKEIEDSLSQHCLKLYNKKKQNWISGGSFKLKETYNILKDSKFDKLNNWIDESVKDFSSQLSFFIPLKCMEGWFNIYNKNDFQMYHDHRPMIVSCVYFLQCKKEGAPLFFMNDRELQLYTPQGGIQHSPVPGKLVIFSSYIGHGVGKHEDDSPRVTLAHNYGRHEVQFQAKFGV
tara:strand:+ start:2931 stop:3518 length:588 start_codon:yes stop_codon:yes gene_type:complete